MREMRPWCVGRWGSSSDWKWKTGEQVDLETWQLVDGGVMDIRPINRA